MTLDDGSRRRRRDSVRPMLRRLLTPLIAATLLQGAPALAQSAQQLAHARALFREGIALETAGDWAAALAKFRAVADVKMTPQVRFNIAVCEEHLGRLAAALGDFQLVQDEALDQTAQDLAAKAAEHVKAIMPRVPKLTITRGAGADMATIALDGVALGVGVLGTELRLDPGPHTVTASVAGEPKFSREVQLAEGEAQEVDVVIAGAGGEVADVHVPVSAEAPRATGGGRRTTGWILVGAGATSAAAGGLFLILRGRTIDDLDAICRDGHCPPSSQSIADRGKLYTGLAEATLIAGVAGLTVGSILLIGHGADPKADTATTGARPRSTLALEGNAPGTLAGASLVARF